MEEGKEADLSDARGEEFGKSGEKCQGREKISQETNVEWMMFVDVLIVGDRSQLRRLAKEVEMVREF